MSVGPLSIGLSGMQSAQARIDLAAGRIARSGLQVTPEDSAAPASDLVADLVGQRVDSLLYTANLRTVQAADRMLGSLLDVTA